jgi:hypothetical protein
MSTPKAQRSADCPDTTQLLELLVSKDAEIHANLKIGKSQFVTAVLLEQ